MGKWALSVLAFKTPKLKYSLLYYDSTQVTDHLRAACKHTGVRIVPIVGGIAAPKQERLLSYKPPILVATPGRLWQLIQEHPYLQDLSTVKFLVIDEADR